MARVDHLFFFAGSLINYTLHRMVFSFIFITLFKSGRVGGVVQRRAINWRCQRRMVAGVTSSPRRRRAGSSRVVRRSGRGRSRSFAGVACVVGARRVGGAGPGSRSPWWCRIRFGARSSRGAWRTSGRSVAAPPGDRAGPPVAAKQQVRTCAEFRAPTGPDRLARTPG